MSNYEDSSTDSSDQSMSDNDFSDDSNDSFIYGEDPDEDLGNSSDNSNSSCMSWGFDWFFEREDCECDFRYENEDDDEDEPTVLNASKSNDLEAVQKFIDITDFCVNDKINGTTCLHEAVKEGHVEMVELLLDSGARLHSLDSRGHGPLHVAIQIKNRKSRWKMVHLLMKAGASVVDINEPYQKDFTYDTTCIHEAVKINDYHLVLFLLNAGAKINCFDRYDTSDRITPLQVALSLKGQSRYDMVKKLIAAGSDVKLGHDGDTSLHTAAKQKMCSWELMKLLLDAGAELNCLNKQNISPLALAAEENHLSLVKIMIDAGADVNLAKCCSNSALQLAIEQKHKTVVDLLLKSGVDVNARDDDGESILYCAVNEYLHDSSAMKKTEILRMVLTHDVVMVSSEFGPFSPFKLLLQEADIEAIHLFFEHGFKLENCGVEFPLHEAAINNQNEVLSYLLKSSLFDVDGINDQGSTALLVAVYYVKLDNVRSLIEWGANGNIACVEKEGSIPLTNVGQTALSEAFATRASKFGKLLLAAGASLDLSAENSDVQCTVNKGLRGFRAMNFLESFIEYFVLLKSQGYKLYKGIRRYLKKKMPSTSNMMKKCKYELNLLKSEVFFRHLTLYDLLLRKDITCYIGNNNVRERFESLQVEERFPHYGEQIKEYYLLSCLRRELIYVALRGLRKIFGFRFCGDEIFSIIMLELSLKDLRNLCAV